MAISNDSGTGLRTTFLTGESDLSISFGNLRIAPYEVTRILDVKIEQKINEHAALYFKGLLSEQKKDSYAEASTVNTNVVLSVVDESEKDYILFQGIVREVEIGVTQGAYHLEVSAVSYSSLLDTMKKTRSFQDKKMSYEQLAEQVAAGYANAYVMDQASNGVPTNKFIMQHMETDWEFLKRMASHFYTGMVCDPRYNSPMNYFGVPQIQQVALDCYEYSIKKDMETFHCLSENGLAELYESDFVYYHIETHKLINIGDEVLFQNKKLYAAEITGVMDNGIFVNHCVLATKKGLSQPYQSHDRIVGGSFNGRIMEIQNDRVKVSLDIDGGNETGELCFFPYSTIYSSQDGSGWYCMPELGDSVRIYFPDGEEDHAYAISSVHEPVDPSLQQPDTTAGADGGNGAGGYSGQRDDPTVKSLRSKSGKEIRLTPDGIYIIADGTTITLTDEDGVSIISNENIEFQSEKNIILSAQADVNIVGKTGVDLSCSETASIKMNENVEIIGQEVKSN